MRISTYHNLVVGSALPCIRPILDPNNRNALLRWTRQGLKAEALSVPAAAWSSPCLEWLEGGVGFGLTRISLHCSFPAEYSHFAFPLSFLSNSVGALDLNLRLLLF